MITDNILKKLSIKEAVEALQEGKIVILPTDTVYGIAGNALREVVCAQIFAVKKRPLEKALIWQFASIEAAKEFVEWSEEAEILANKFWPGPLTIVLKRKNSFETLGVRIPDCPETLKVLEMCRFPLAMPSANPSNLPAAKSESEILNYFGSEKAIAGFVLTKTLKYGKESTIVSLTESKPQLLRLGAITLDQIAEVFPIQANL